MNKYLPFIALMIATYFELPAQSRFSDITFQWEVGIGIKSSNLHLNDLNQQLVNAGYLPFNSYTQEGNLYLNVQPSLFPFGLSMSFSKGGVVNVARDRASYSNITVSYLSIAIFEELRYKRCGARFFLTYETGHYRGEFYIKNTSSVTSLATLNGSKILNQSEGIKPCAQLLVSLGKKRQNLLGFEWSYFYRLSQLAAIQRQKKD